MYTLVLSVAYKDDSSSLWNEKKLHWKYPGRSTVQTLELDRSQCFAIPPRVLCVLEGLQMSRLGKDLISFNLLFLEASSTVLTGIFSSAVLHSLSLSCEMLIIYTPPDDIFQICVLLSKYRWSIFYILRTVFMRGGGGKHTTLPSQK